MNKLWGTSNASCYPELPEKQSYGITGYEVSRIQQAQEEVEAKAADALTAEVKKPPRTLGMVATIQTVVAGEYGISRADILSPYRKHKIVYPRKLAMYLARKMTNRPFPEIARYFRRKNHTTILFACRDIEESAETDSKVVEELERLTLLVHTEIESQKSAG